MKKILFVLNDSTVDPLGVMYLMGNIEADFDVLFVKGFDEKVLNKVNIKFFDILAFSTITGSHKLHNRIAEYYKQKSNIITIMGGPHPTFFPKESLDDLFAIDYICVGEGIVAFDKFIKGQKTNNIIDRYEDYTCQLELPVDINTLKINREVIYSKGNKKSNGIRNFMGSFGCPFDCSYCFNKSYSDMYDSKYRMRYVDPEKLVNEMIDCTENFNTTFLYIQDDTFIVNKKWFNTVTQLIKDRIDLPYHCHVRCDIMTDEIAKQLKTTGCKSVTFAVENASEEYRKKYLNRRMTNEQVLKTSKILHDNNILFRIENMVGLPDNTLKDNLETMKLNYKCKPTIAWASLFQPYPSTKLGDYCVVHNLWDGDIDSINNSFFDTSPINISNKEEVQKLQKLFSLSVDSWFMKIITPMLIKLPLNFLYKKLYIKFKNKKYNKLYGV